MRANWDRLEPGRASHRITLALLRATPEAVPTQAAPAPPASARTWQMVEGAERALYGDPISPRVRQLERAILDDDPKAGREAARAIKEGLKDRDIVLSRRITAIVLDCLLAPSRSVNRNSCSFEDWEPTIRQLEPLAFDPQWRRWTALNWDSIDDPDELENELADWRAYLDSLPAVAGMSDDDRRTIRAVVHARMGRRLTVKAIMETNWSKSLGGGPQTKTSPKKWLAPASSGAASPPTKLSATASRAIDELRLAIEAGTTIVEPYETLASLYLRLDRIDDAALTNEALLAARPDHSAALRANAEYFAKIDQPDRALECLRRWQALHPLDVKGKALEGRVLCSRVRLSARRKDWAGGRAALAELERAAQNQREKSFHAALRAAFEQCAELANAGVPEGYAHWRAAALALIGSELPLGLILTIESRLLEAPLAVRKAHFTSWRAAMKKGRTASAAAFLVVLVVDYSDACPNLPLDELENDVRAWLLKCSRLTFGNEELQEVCGFLHAKAESANQYRTLIKKGIRSFPRCPFYHFWEAAAEIAKGPRRCNSMLANYQLAEARDLAEASTDPRERALVEVIGQFSSLLEMTSNSIRMANQFYDDRMEDDDEYDDDDDESNPVSLDALPPEMRILLEAAAREMGLDPNEVLRKAEGHGPFSTATEEPSPSRPSPSRSRPGRPRQR
jgi:hypothetical protein